MEHRSNHHEAGLVLIEDIGSRIFTVRGVQVMMDTDLAVLYRVETKVLNQTVKRNRKRFPVKFCFRLTDDEVEILRSQIVTLEENRMILPLILFTDLSAPFGMVIT